MNTLVPLLFLSAPLVPFLIIYVIGATLCIVRWRRHPKRSCLALVAFLLFLARLLGNVAKQWLMLRKDDFGWDIDTLTFNIGIMASIDTVVGVVAWILLLIALFSHNSLSVPVEGHGISEGD